MRNDLVIGCDLNSRKIALFIYGIDNASSVTIIEVPKKVLNRAIVCSTLFQQTREFLEGYSSAVLFIEEPLVGRNIKASLMIAQVYGVVLAAAMLAGIERLYPVHVSTWKRETINDLPRANHKPAIREWLERTHPVCASATGGDQDLIDAACIAIYGRGVLHRAGISSTN